MSTSTSSIRAYGTARSTIPGQPLTPAELRLTDQYWAACNYLALGMIYARHALRRAPLQSDHIKNRPLGHWGSSLSSRT